MTRTMRTALLGVAAIVVTGGVVLQALGHGIGFGPHGGRTEDAIPASSFLAVHADVGGLRKTALWDQVTTLVGDPGKLLGLPTLTATCGFDPLANVDEIDVAVPEQGDRGDFGVALGGALDTGQLVDCVKKIARPSGGDPSAELVTRERSGFHVVDQNGTPRFALRDGGPYLVGRGAWLEQMVDSAAEAAPSWRSNESHRALVHALEVAAGVPPTSERETTKLPLVATALLPSDVRDRVRHEMETETDETSKRRMLGILGVSGAGVALVPPVDATPGKPATLFLELRCETAEACGQVSEFLLAKRLAFSKDFRIRLLGLGTALDTFAAHADGATVHASVSFDPAAVVRAIGRVLHTEPSPSASASTPTQPTQTAPAMPTALPARNDAPKLDGGDDGPAH